MGRDSDEWVGVKLTRTHVHGQSFNSYYLLYHTARILGGIKFGEFGILI